jgi:rod shape-determining protein MreC
MATLGRRRHRWESLIKAVVSLLVVGLVFQTIASRRSGSDNPLSKSVVFVSSPFLRLGSVVHGAVASFWTGAFSSSELEEENKQLCQELAQLRLDKATDRAQQTLEWLSQEISTTIPRGTYDLIPVSVLSGPMLGDRQITWVNGGREQGLEAGMVVLGPHGIVGEIDEVYSSTALVELITDEKAAWGAEIDERGETGVVHGTGDPELIELEFAQTAIKAKPGDVVVSSGMAGSLAPGGVPFGTVEEIRTNKAGEPIAVVRVPQAPSKLRTVFVIPVGRIPFKPEKD